MPQQHYEMRAYWAGVLLWSLPNLTKGEIPKKVQKTQTSLKDGKVHHTMNGVRMVMTELVIDIVDGTGIVQMINLKN